MRNMEEIFAELQDLIKKFDEMKLTKMDDLALGDASIIEEMNNLLDPTMRLTSEQITEMQLGKIPVGLVERRIDDLEQIRQRATKLKKEVLEVELGGDYYPDEIAKFNEEYEALYTKIDIAFRALARVSTVKTEAYMELKQQLADAKKAREACRYELERQREEKQRIENLQAELQRQLAELEGQLERISGAEVKGVVAERVYEDQKIQIEGAIETLKKRLEALGNKLPEVEAEIAKAEAALKEAEDKVANLAAEVQKEKGTQELAEKIRKDRQERIQKEREPKKEPVSIFDTPSGSDGTPSEDPEKDPENPEKDPENPEKDPENPEKDPENPEKDPENPEKDPENPEKDPTKPEDDPEKTEDNIVMHNVTMHITGPEGKETSFVIPVGDGQPLFPLGPDGLVNKNSLAYTIFFNGCKEAYGDAAEYMIRSCSPEDFDRHNTPITEDMQIDATVAKYHRVEFKNDDQVLYSVLVEEGAYLDPNLVERVDRAVNFGYDNIDDVGRVGQPKNKRSGGPLKKAFTGLKYWGEAGSNSKEDGKLAKFKFDQPITGSVVLEAQTGVKAKSVLSGAAGLATGVAIDLAGGPLAGRIAIGAASAAKMVTKIKLNHHKEMVSYEEIQQMTGIKKASAKLSNHFRKTQTIKNLEYFLNGLIIGASAVEIGRAAKGVVERIADSRAPQPSPSQTGPQGGGNGGGGNGGTPTEPTTTPKLKDGSAFEYGYRDSFNAVGNTNNVHLYTDLTKDAVPTHFYDTVNRSWLPINDQTLAQVASNPGQYAVRYMNGSVDMMWESAVDALENVGGIAR